MQTATDYLLRTESAVRLLFNGIDSYLDILRQATGLVFVTSEPHGPAQDAEFAAWRTENEQRLTLARKAEKEFIAESFALGTLCGSVLQVASKAIELYSVNASVPSGVLGTIKPQHAKFCIGRTIRTVPLGLVIYAARNQHTHFDDDSLREPSASIFYQLATAHGYGNGQLIVDPAFDLSNKSLYSFASNATSLIGWRSYEKYSSDMHSMLGA